jgi:hypothetical protein
MVRSDTKSPFLECEECASAWNSTKESLTPGNSFLGMEVESGFASIDEIKQAGWPTQVFEQA